MKNKLKEKLDTCLFVGLGMFILLGLASMVGSRNYRQTKPDDMVTRNALDDEFDRRIKVFEDLGIQADTAILTAGKTIDTIYLEKKYSDLTYKIFVNVRTEIGVHSEFSNIQPLTDSSFVLSKRTDDEGIVNWMTIK
jgi:hypothetical protein